MEPVCFEIRQADFLNKALEREFGRLILHSRELWRRVMELFLLAAFWYCDFSLLSLSLTSREDYFLGGAVTGIGLALTAVYTAAAIAMTVYLFGFRAAFLGRKRLRKIDDGGIMRFDDAQMHSETEKGTVESSYEDFAQIVDEIYEGKQAFYLRLIGTSLYVIIQKKCFVSGKPEDFRDFIREKTGKPVKYIK